MLVFIHIHFTGLMNVASKGYPLICWSKRHGYNKFKREQNVTENSSKSRKIPELPGMGRILKSLINQHDIKKAKLEAPKSSASASSATLATGTAAEAWY